MSSPLNLVPERKWQQIIAFHNGRNKHNSVFDQNYITFHDLWKSQSKAVKQRPHEIFQLLLCILFVYRTIEDYSLILNAFGDDLSQTLFESLLAG